MLEVSKVSIIIPVYNGEKYINRCLDSVLNQTYTNIEIILVNDGSDDNSYKLIKDYCMKDNRIKLINKANTGASDSRNRALEIASGEYIMFLDCDDWIDLNVIEDTVKISKNNSSDIVIFTYTREFKDHSKEKVFNLPDKINYTGKELKEFHRKILGPINDEISNVEGLDSLGTIWGKLYKRKIINCKFIDLKEIGTSEDNLFNLFVFNNVEKVTFINKSYYHYWKENENSLTTKYNPHLLSQWKKLFEYMEKFLIDENLDYKFNQALSNRIAMSVLGLGLNECKKDNKANIIQKMHNIDNILRDKLIVNSLKTLDIRKFPIYWRLFFIFNKRRNTFLTFCMLTAIEQLRVRR